MVVTVKDGISFEIDSNEADVADLKFKIKIL